MKIQALLLVSVVLAVSVPIWAQAAGGDQVKGNEPEKIKLPAPRIDGTVSVEKAIRERRSLRSYSAEPLSLGEAAQILWAAYGVTEPRPGGPVFLRGGLRAAPSAGALYPLEIYLVAGKVTGLDAGVYRYVSEKHELAKVKAGDQRDALCRAALGQGWIRQAPASLVIAAVLERTEKKYGERGRERYVWMDAGFAGENVYLQARALGLGCCIAGAFDDAAVKRAVQMAGDEVPVCILGLGRRK